MAGQMEIDSVDTTYSYIFSMNIASYPSKRLIRVYCITRFYGIECESYHLILASKIISIANL